MAKKNLIYETIANIAYIAGVNRYYSGDSRADMQLFISLAKKFEKEYKGTDWDDDSDPDAPDYITAIEEHVEENLRLVKKFIFNYPEGAKEKWDNIEVHPCKDDGKCTYQLDSDSKEEPDFWTVYLHMADLSAGGIMAVADLPTEKEANDVAELIHNAVITFKDNGYMATNRNEVLHRKFNLFIDERIHSAHSSQTKAAYEIVKDQFNNFVKS